MPQDTIDMARELQEIAERRKGTLSSREHGTLQMAAVRLTVLEERLAEREAALRAALAGKPPQKKKAAPPEEFWEDTWPLDT